MNDHLGYAVVVVVIIPHNGISASHSSAPLRQLQSMSKGFIQHVDHVVSLSAALQSSVQKPFWSVITVIYYHVPCATQIYPIYSELSSATLGFLLNQPKKHGMIGAVGLIARPLSMLILRRSGRGMRNWPSTTSSLPQVAAEDGDGWTKLATLVDKIWTTMIKYHDMINQWIWDCPIFRQIRITCIGSGWIPPSEPPKRIRNWTWIESTS